MPKFFSQPKKKTYGPRTHSETVLSHWDDLGSRLKDSRSIDQQLAQLLLNKENKNTAKQFRGTDAKVVINTIDKVLKHNQVPDRIKLSALSLLRQLAGASCQVPKSYKIGGWTRYTVKNDIFTSGGFADIRQGRLGARVVAVKSIRISQDTDVEEIHKTFCKESVLWMNISHPNILKLLAVEVKPQANKFSMITEMMTNGNVTNYIRVNKANRLRLLKDVANGLQHLHDIGIIHGDLKGVNILINNKTPPRACLADFGLCSLAPIIGFDPTTRGAAGGTFGYMAPELYRGGNPSKTTDMYAFGMVIYEVVTGARPFGQHGFMELPLLTAEGWRPPRLEDPVAMFGQGTWEFVEKCWDENSEQRPTAGEALEHFKRIAATSTDVNPGPVPSVRGTVVARSSRPDSTSRSFRGIFSHHRTDDLNRFQQASFAARVLADSGIALPLVLTSPRQT